MKRLALAIVVAAISAPSFADTYAAERPYIGIDYQIGTFEQQSGASAEPTAIRLRGGTELSPMLAVEAHAAMGAESDTLVLPGVNYEVELNALYSVFVRPQLNLGDVVSIYGLLGYTYADMKATSSNPIPFPSTSGFQKKVSFGGGADLKIYKNVRIGADYVEYIDGYKAVSAGVRISL
jgi:opacity protein-like surface antigen